jgi:Type I restriction modification DNA specificity domain
MNISHGSHALNLHRGTSSSREKHLWEKLLSFPTACGFVLGNVIGEYLVAQIYSGVVKNRISVLTGGTTNPHLNVREVRDFVLPIPPLDEQLAVVDKLHRHDEHLLAEQNHLTKLLIVKAGLSSDLLTGRIRTCSR